VPEHITDSRIPEGLRKRWQTFGEAAKRAWSEVDKTLPHGTTAERFSMFWRLMEKYAGGKLPGDEQKEEIGQKLGVGSNITPAQAEKCKQMGYPLAPNPIAVIALMAKGLSHEEAVKQALAEGKYHGISELACKLRLKEAGML